MIKIDNSADGQWYYTVTAKNNEPVVTSETYASKQMCKKGIHALTEAILLSLSDKVRITDHTKNKA